MVTVCVTASPASSGHGHKRSGYGLPWWLTSLPAHPSPEMPQVVPERMGLREEGPPDLLATLAGGHSQALLCGIG